MIKSVIKRIRRYVRVKRMRLYYSMFYNRILKNRENRSINKIRQKGQANVLFIASNLAMWKHQYLYELLRTDKRFNPYIVICPFCTYTPQDKAVSVAMLKEYFDIHGTPYYLYENDSCLALEEMHPDIIFYPQPYEGLFGNKLDFQHHEDALLCYSPYALYTVNPEWVYNVKLQNRAWKLYYPTQFHLKDAQEIMYNRGRNVVVSGYANADVLTGKLGNKKGGNSMKHIVWAPHFSIASNSSMKRGAFLWLSNLMIRLAVEYKGRIQWTFKPHPRLKTELYKLQEWGEERTDAYFQKWEEMENTQVEMGDFVDLFCSSDALIHDCGSFTAEYLYTKKPVLFTARDFEPIEEMMNEFGERCLNLHYKAHEESDVVSFIEDIVLNGEDSLFEKRNDFYENVLCSKKHMNAAEYIYNDMIKSLYS